MPARRGSNVWEPPSPEELAVLRDQIEGYIGEAERMLKTKAADEGWYAAARASLKTALGDDWASQFLNAGLNPPSGRSYIVGFNARRDQTALLERIDLRLPILQRAASGPWAHRQENVAEVAALLASGGEPKVPRLFALWLRLLRGSDWCGDGGNHDQLPKLW